jgi:hypothetical protein
MRRTHARRRNVKEPRVIVAAMRDASGLCWFPHPEEGRRLVPKEGMARRKAQTCGVRSSFRRSGGRPSARHMRSRCEAVAHLKCAQVGQRPVAHLKNSPTQRSSAHVICGVSSNGSAPGLAFSAGLELPASVSWLPAGTPSGPGRSSDTARVLRCDEARGRRTSSRFTTPHDRAPQWTR